MNLFKIPSLKSICDLCDVIHAFQLIINLIDCEDLTNMFITRVISYDLRLTRMFLETAYRTIYSYLATIPRLLREWNEILSNIVCVNRLT